MGALQGLREIHGERFRLLEADALAIEPASLCESASEDCRQPAIQYRHSASNRLAKKGDGLAGMTLMFQKKSPIESPPGRGRGPMAVCPSLLNVWPKRNAPSMSIAAPLRRHPRSRPPSSPFNHERPPSMLR